jgi:hypothetical protein
MDSRLIFLHHGRRFEVRQDVLTKALVRLEADVHPGSVPGAEAIYDAEGVGVGTKKSRRSTTVVPVLKLTQVGEMNILRRSRDRS